MHIMRKAKRERERETWMPRRFFSASERLARSATMRKRRRRFLMMETADRHRLWASAKGFFGATSKSLSSFSIRSAAAMEGEQERRRMI